MTAHRQKLIVGMAVLCLAHAQASWADAYFDQGKRLYDKKNYREALAYFHKSAQDQPWDSSAAYYEALCYHMMADYKKAAEAYANVVEHFPGSAAYVNAAAALKTLDPDYFRRKKAQETGTASGTTSGASQGGAPGDVKALLEKVRVNAPNQAKIAVDRKADKNWVDGTINGHGYKFDFVGSSTTISPKDAHAANLTVASNGYAMVTIAVGQVTEYNFPVKVADTDRPKLGTDFFHQLAYRLGPTEIEVKKGSAGAYDLQFSRSGTDLKVSLRINGRSATVIFDPQGTENVCPRNRARELGLEVEDKQEVNMVSLQNPNGAMRGQPGFGEVKEVSSAQAKIIATGPVGTGDSYINFHIDDKAKEVKVGPAAFPGWQYDIDEAKHVIHFTRQ